MVSKNVHTLTPKPTNMLCYSEKSKVADKIKVVNQLTWK